MSSNALAQKPEFDEAAADYREQLNRGLRFTGESMEHFAEQRVRWTAQCLDKLGATCGQILDFGCGTGTAAPVLTTILRPHSIVGTDPSGESLTIARETHGRLSAYRENLRADELGTFDLAYCNGVFHHIPVAERDSAMASVFAALRPGGCFALWENNPWNPAVRFIMSRVPFDRDAILLWPWETRRRLRAAGFQVVRTDYIFIFPSSLKFLRPIEPALCKLPLGGQYVVLAQKPT